MKLNSFFNKRQAQTRLITDHHRLILESLCLKENLWKVLATVEYEVLNPDILNKWLKSFPIMRRSKFTLILVDDLFEFAAITENSYEEIRQEILNHHSSEEIFIEIIEKQAIVLDQTSIAIYQEACKACKIKINQVSPQNFNVNLLPWREKAQQKNI